MLEDLIPPVRRSQCRLREIMESLTDKDQVILRDALANRTLWSAKSLAKALTDRGLPIGEKGLSRRDNPCDECICR